MKKNNSINQIDLIKNQIDFILSELNENNDYALTTRLDLLNKIMRLKESLQTLEIESHLKRVDAVIIAMIVRRFIPDASNEDVIKIYKEEYQKWLINKDNRKN